MGTLGGILIASQLLFTVVATIYFYTNIKNQKNNKQTVNLDSKKEMEKLKKMRTVSLTQPLSEKTRPTDFKEIIGQEKGIKALRAAICGPNPQHVIIYGPPGIGKTAAARLVLEEAISSESCPFNKESPFIEMDATILQFDERSIADPLIGSVHDPIYQGAGAYGQAGIPQPKMGAVSKAHGGILFLDEIGELHPIQMNKLLKVLEDRKVFLSSAYYSSEEQTTPKYIQDIFENGLPADFRLIGATTRRPEELPPALRSRCTEIFFRSLKREEVTKIAANTCIKAGFDCEKEVPTFIARYAMNGRDTVNIIQTSASLATLEKRAKITMEDVEEVIENGRYSPNLSKKVKKEYRAGVVHGLAVVGATGGMLLEVEATVKQAMHNRKGTLNITGIIDEEEINSGSGKIKRKSNARSSVDNVVTVMSKLYGLNVAEYDIHINFPGGIPIDGPSAGVAIFTALYSAIQEKPVSSQIAMTGEVSIKGKVLPVGGVSAKIEAAVESGIEKVLIPKENDQKSFGAYDVQLCCIETVQELIQVVFEEKNTHKTCDIENTTISAMGI